MADTNVAEMKFEDGKQAFTEEQTASIAQQALKELADEKKVKEVNIDDIVNNDEELAKLKAEEDARAKAETDAQKAKDESAAKAKADADEKARIEAEKNKGETDEQKEARLKTEKEAADKKAADQAAGKVSGDDQAFKIPDDVRTKSIEELALKESLTLKEAEEQIAKDEATVNKYKKDPVEMARALRHATRDMDRAKAELKATREAAGKAPAPVLNNVRDYVHAQLEPIKDKVITAYRKEYPEITDGMEDEKVYGLIKKDAMDRTSKILEENESKIISSAKERKAELIMSLAEVDKAFIPDIKAALDRTSPRQILDKEFKFDELVYWAKGRQMDRLIKEAEERGFKRGQEGAKIIGEKTPGAGNKQAGGGGAKKTAESRLNDQQKERALNMFDGAPGMADEDKYAAYIETYPEEFQK